MFDVFATGRRHKMKQSTMMKASALSFFHAELSVKTPRTRADGICNSVTAYLGRGEGVHGAGLGWEGRNEPRDAMP